MENLNAHTEIDRYCVDLTMKRRPVLVQLKHDCLTCTNIGAESDGKRLRRVSCLSRSPNESKNECDKGYGDCIYSRGPMIEKKFIV